jgi:hypothetical protein
MKAREVSCQHLEEVDIDVVFVVVLQAEIGQRGEVFTREKFSQSERRDPSAFGKVDRRKRPPWLLGRREFR